MFEPSKTTASIHATNIALTLLLLGLLTPAWGEKIKPASLAGRGRMIYKSRECSACHYFHGEGCKDGVPLDGLANRRSKEFLAEHLKDPELHVRKHAKEFGGDANLMPPQDLTPKEIDSLVAYLLSESHPASKAVPSKPTVTKQRRQPKPASSG